MTNVSCTAITRDGCKNKEKLAAVPAMSSISCGDDDVIADVLLRVNSRDRTYVLACGIMMTVTEETFIRVNYDFSTPFDLVQSRNV